MSEYSTRSRHLVEYQWRGSKLHASRCSLARRRVEPSANKKADHANRLGRALRKVVRVVMIITQHLPAARACIQKPASFPILSTFCPRTPQVISRTTSCLNYCLCGRPSRSQLQARRFAVCSCLKQVGTRHTSDHHHEARFHEDVFYLNCWQTLDPHQRHMPVASLCSSISGRHDHV